jgi:hypothetical protein
MTEDITIRTRLIDLQHRFAKEKEAAVKPFIQKFVEDKLALQKECEEIGHRPSNTVVEKNGWRWQYCWQCEAVIEKRKCD